MTNDLIHATAPPKAPAPSTRTQADLLGVYRSRIVREPDGISWSITEGDAPRGRDLELLQARRSELAAAPGADTAQIASRVARLFQRFPTMANASREQVAAYVADLKRFPLWAIDKGMTAIVQGLVLKATQFPPSSLDVQKAVRQAMEPVVDELALLTNVLNATVTPDVHLSPERRREIADEVRGMMRENAPAADPDMPRDPRLPSSFDDYREKLAAERVAI